LQYYLGSEIKRRGQDSMEALNEKRSKMGEKNYLFPKLTIVGDKAGIPRTSCGKSIK
jgi:hypothetical protein